MAKKNRATFAKREKERARLSKQAEKRQKRQQTPDPNAAQIPGPMPLMPIFDDDAEPSDDVVLVEGVLVEGVLVEGVLVEGVLVDEGRDEVRDDVIAVDEVAHAGDAPREP